MQEGAGECTTPNFGAKRAVQSAPECTIGADSLVRSKRVGVPAVRIADAIQTLVAGDVETARFDSQWTARLVHLTAPDAMRPPVVGASYEWANSCSDCRGPAEALSKSVVPESVTQMTEINSWGRGPPVGGFAVCDALGAGVNHFRHSLHLPSSA